MICVDDGPLEIRPYPGYHWAKIGKPQRFPAYHRDQGTMALFTALDLKEDVILGHGKHCKNWRELLVFLKYLRSRIPRRNGSTSCSTTFRHITAGNQGLGRPQTMSNSFTRRLMLPGSTGSNAYFAPVRKFALSGVSYADHKGADERDPALYRLAQSPQERREDPQRASQGQSRVIGFGFQSDVFL